MNNIDRRDAGLAYRADMTFLPEMIDCKKKLKVLNSTDPWEYDKIEEAVRELLPNAEKPALVLPFICEYGKHITIGKNFFANFNCTMLDVATITIGENCLFGPNVSLYTAGHPVHPVTRASGYEYGKPIKIGDNCWIGGSTVVLPGVSIGNNVVIGAGSVVTKDIPDNVIAVGNPCRVLRTITEEDRRKLFKNEEIDEEAWNDICGVM